MVLHCISTGVDGTALYQHRCHCISTSMCRWYCIVSAHCTVRSNDRFNNIGYAMLMSINDCEMKGAKKVILVLSSMAPIL